MDELPQIDTTQTLEIPVDKKEQTVNLSEVTPVTPGSTQADLDAVGIEITTEEGVVATTTAKVNEIRHGLGLEGVETDVPSVDLNRKKIEELQKRKMLGLESNHPEKDMEFARIIVAKVNTFMQDPRIAGLSEDEFGDLLEQAETSDPQLSDTYKKLGEEFRKLDLRDKSTVQVVIDNISHEAIRDSVFHDYIYKKLGLNPYAALKELLSMIESNHLLKDPAERKKVIAHFKKHITENNDTHVVDEQGNKIPLVILSNQPVSHGASFDDLDKTGEEIIQAGKKAVVRASEYNLGSNLRLRIQGQSIKYIAPEDPGFRINVVYDRDSKEIEKMSFSSSSPFMAGKTILDIVERVPVGTSIFKGEESMSADSFPLLLHTLAQFQKKSPGRFSVEQIGEFDLNDQGEYSIISHAETIDEKLRLLNVAINDLAVSTGVSLSKAYIQNVKEKQKIILPKIKVAKNF